MSRNWKGFMEEEAGSRAFRTNRVQRVEEGKKTFQADRRAWSKVKRQEPNSTFREG